MCDSAVPTEAISLSKWIGMDTSILENVTEISDFSANKEISKNSQSNDCGANLLTIFHGAVSEKDV